MARIKHTKNELRAQRDALARYERFLPMLQLKKQQLQTEILAVEARVAEKLAEEERVQASLATWKRLFSEPVDVAGLVTVKSVSIEEGNIAGVAIPVLRSMDFDRKPYSLFDTPQWFDDASDVLEALTRLRVEREVLARQKACIIEELRVTSQRVNLFEKVKIPECKENIRSIRIFLGDEQTASVARGKLAKRRTQKYEAEDAAA